MNQKLFIDILCPSTMNSIEMSRGKNNLLKIGSKNLNLENWEVYHPNGKHMFTCGEKKASWYLDRDLAEIFDDNKIILTFIPKGNGFEDNEEFGRAARQPICVVSGVNDGLQRHHIVPYCYRSYFPEAYKTRNHHDVVLINHILHSEYEKKATVFKDEIANVYNVKTIKELNLEYTIKLRELGKDDAILMNTIHSIFKSYNKVDDEVTINKLKFIAENTNIPFDTIIKYNYMQLYKLYLHVKDLHKENILKFKKENDAVFDHGYYVAQKLNTDAKIKEFVTIWRNHFIETMKPKHMPHGWSVDFRIKTKI